LVINPIENKEQTKKSLTKYKLADWVFAQCVAFLAGKAQFLKAVLL